MVLPPKAGPKTQDLGRGREHGMLSAKWVIFKKTVVRLKIKYLL
jgi:hypothetical protein